MHDGTSTRSASHERTVALGGRSTSFAGMTRIRFEGLRVGPALSALPRSPVGGYFVCY